MKILLHMLFFCVLFSICAIYSISFFGGFEGLGDGNDYAGLARSIIRGEGFALGHIYPLGFVFSDEIPQPNNMWAPGYPLYLAIWLLALGVSDNSVLIASIAALWLMILVSFFIARRMVGVPYGFLGASLIASNQILLYATVETSPEIFAGALLTVSIILLYFSQRKFSIALSAILFGFSILSRYQAVIIMLPLLVFLLGKKPRVIIFWSIIVMATLLPWLIRNWIVLGSPFFTLQAFGEFTKGMGRFDDFYFTYRSFTPMTFWYALGQFPFDLLKKFVGGLIFFIKAFPLRLNFLGIIPLFVAVISIKRLESRKRQLVLFTVFATLLVVILGSFDGHHDRHLVTLQPFLILTALIGFQVLVNEFKFKQRKIILIIAILLLFLPARFPFQERRLTAIASQSRVDQIAYRRISEIIPSDKIVVSDVSDAIWWYGDRLAVWIPVHLIDLLILVDEGKCDYVYLSKPVDYMSKLDDEEIADFMVAFEAVAEFEGPGKLYKIRESFEISPDSRI